MAKKLVRSATISLPFLFIGAAVIADFIFSLFAECPPGWWCHNNPMWVIIGAASLSAGILFLFDGFSKKKAKSSLKNSKKSI